MKAIQFKHYGSPDVIELINRIKPSPQENDVIVKVYVSSVTTADTMIREGKPCYGRLFLGLQKHKNPIAGTGFSGIVESVGNKVSLFKKGDKVFGETGISFSANAEYLSIAEDGVILPLDDMNYEEAAPICDGALTSMAFLKDLANLQQGQNILIIGASGSLGTAAIQIAKSLGANVTGVCSHSNIQLVKALGVDHVIDYTLTDFTKLNKTYDIIYDTIGNKSFKACKKSLKNKGTYLSPVLSFSLLLQMLKTSFLHNKTAKFAAIGLKPASELKAHLNDIKKLIKSKTLNTVIDKTYSLEQAVDAHRYVDSGHKKGNVILKLCNV